MKRVLQRSRLCVSLTMDPGLNNGGEGGHNVRAALKPLMSETEEAAQTSVVNHMFFGQGEER